MANQNMQEHLSRFDEEFSEMYEVVRTVIALRGETRYRIEVLEECHSGQFKVGYWRLRFAAAVHHAAKPGGEQQDQFSINREG